MKWLKRVIIILVIIGIIIITIPILLYLAIIAPIILEFLHAIITTTNPMWVNNQPAGITYTGPNTTAIAGYYCIYMANGTGYTIQLNILLNNGLLLQNMYNGNISAIAGNQQVVTSMGQPCGWLVISIRNGTAYFGYSSNGVSITWYYNYTVGSVVITPGSAFLIITGDFRRLYAILALYYWNGAVWEPAPVANTDISASIFGIVNHAWVYSHDNVAIVSWPFGAPSPGFNP